MGHLSGYAVHSTSPNLSTFPLASKPNHERYINSPSTTLHEYVTSREDVTFKSFKVTLQNEGKTIRVDIKNPADGKYYPYHVTNLPYSLKESKYPVTKLRTGLSFATSNRTTNCEIKNFAVYGNIEEYEKGAETDKKKIDPYTRLEPLTSTRFETVYKPPGLA